MREIGPGEDRDAKTLRNGENILIFIITLLEINKSFNYILFNYVFFFQYYEMSYGLNVEMHKQVKLNYK